MNIIYFSQGEYELNIKQSHLNNFINLLGNSILDTTKKLKTLYDESSCWTPSDGDVYYNIQRGIAHHEALLREDNKQLLTLLKGNGENYQPFIGQDLKEIKNNNINLEVYNYCAENY